MTRVKGRKQILMHARKKRAFSNYIIRKDFIVIFILEIIHKFFNAKDVGDQYLR